MVLYVFFFKQKKPWLRVAQRCKVREKTVVKNIWNPTWTGLAKPFSHEILRTFFSQKLKVHKLWLLTQKEKFNWIFLRLLFFAFLKCFRSSKKLTREVLLTFSNCLKKCYKKEKYEFFLSDNSIEKKNIITVVGLLREVAVVQSPSQFKPVRR